MASSNLAWRTHSSNSSFRSLVTPNPPTYAACPAKLFLSLDTLARDDNNPCLHAPLTCATPPCRRWPPPTCG
jgi:hypothetical protein